MIEFDDSITTASKTACWSPQYWMNKLDHGINLLMASKPPEVQTTFCIINLYYTTDLLTWCEGRYIIGYK